MGSNPLYYSDSQYWDSYFNPPADTYISTFVAFDTASLSEVTHQCVDTGNAVFFISMFKNAGLPIPDVVIEFVRTANQYLQSINVLKLGFKMEGVMVTTDSYTGFNHAQNVWLDTQLARIPNYSRLDMVSLNVGC